MLTRRSVLSFPAIAALNAQQQTKMFGDAQAYERFMGRWSRLLAPAVIDFAALPARARVLDVGSGTGSLAFAIAELKPNATVVGIDPSKDYVAFAGSRNRWPHRISFQVGDAQQLDFPGQSFDAALSLLVFNFIPDPKKAAAELRRVVKPGGPVVAAVWDYGDGMRMLRVFWDVAAGLDPRAARLDEKHMSLCREGDLSQLWKQVGFQNVVERPLELAMRFDSFPDYWDAFLLGQGPAGAYVAGLDASQREALRSGLRQRLSNAAESRPFTLQARAWCVRGTIPSRV